MAIRFGLLFLSFIGYFFWLKEKYYVSQELIPVIICTGIGNGMFLAGILNMMPLGVLLIFGFGLIQLRYTKKVKMYISDRNFIWHMGAFFLCCIIFAFLMRGAILTHYDNFSHWALVVKDMLYHDRLPNFESELIMFRSYPTGTAGFIYFICKILGETDGCMAYAQLLISLSCIFTLAVFLNTEKRYSTLLLFSGGIYFLVSGIQVTELLVDTLLALLGLAATVIIYYYRENLKKASLLICPILIFLNCVKNSGIFFWLVNMIFLLYMAVHSKILKKLWKIIAIFDAVLPCMFIYLWKRHVIYVFPEEIHSKHEMSIANYQRVFANKTWEEIREIVTLFIKKTISFQNQGIQMLLIGSIVLIGGFAIASYKKKKFCLSLEMKVGFFCVGSFALYVFSLLGMYLFSMPVGEAKELASYGRYNHTMVMYLYGILLLYVLGNLPPITWSGKRLPQAVTQVIILLLLLFPVWQCRESFSNLWDHSGKEETMYYQMRELKQNYGIPSEKKYFLYISDRSDLTGYCFYVTKYILSSNDVTVCNRDNLEEHIENFENYDYLIVICQDELVRNLMDSKGIFAQDQVIALH